MTHLHATEGDRGWFEVDLLSHGIEVDLTGAQVAFNARREHDLSVAIAGDAEIVNVSNPARVRFHYQESHVAVVGQYLCTWQADFVDGTRKTFPTAPNVDRLTVHAQLD